jgi:RHS repeat-associated protein
VNHNIHGFSSKPSFGNQGLLYYGYRWYSPSLGRWINRDPLEERGGMNLYGFVGNDGVTRWDLLGENAGLAAEDCIPLAPLALSPAALARLGLYGVLVGEIWYICKSTCALPGTWESMRAQQAAAAEAEARAIEGQKQLDDLIRESNARGKGERGKARRNPNPDKQKTRDHQSGRKLPPKFTEPPRPPDVPTIPRGKSK